MTLWDLRQAFESRVTLTDIACVYIAFICVICLAAILGRDK